MKETILPHHPFSMASSRAAILFFLCSIITVQSKGQCFASSTISGTTAVNDNSIGTLAFNNEGNSFSSDNQRASATALVALFTGGTHYLKVTGFGFNIPSYASICGVRVEIEKRAGGLSIGAWVRDNDIRIVKANAVTGTDGGDDDSDWSGTESVYTYGGENDLWGATLTPADVNAPGFGVAISANLNGLLFVFPSAQIDNVRMTVYYNPILPVKLLSFNSTLKNNIAQLDWETADEGENELITLQRSVTGSSQWSDLVSYDLQSINQQKKYSYPDVLNKAGRYEYRLKISNNDQQITYSAIKQVFYSATGMPVAYPNPARDFIVLENIADPRLVVVSNITRQQINLPIQVTAEHTVRINTSKLPKGVYFVGTGNQTLKFFKE
jgi:hypothetical protein